MKNRSKAWGIGLLAWTTIAACTPTIQELGDEPEGGAGGAGSSGAGSVVPNGGREPTPTPGDGGAQQSAAGAPSEDCFSPTRNVELSRDEDAVGCPCDTADVVCVGSKPGEPFWYGMLSCESGRWESVPPTCDTDCFSPTNVPGLALVDPDAGCACNDEPDVCVATVAGDRSSRIALYCEEGKWTPEPRSVPTKSPCELRSADCRVDGVTYPHGARQVPDPFSCNTCDCDSGALVNCTANDCASTPCEEGSYPAKRCVECGPVDECLEIESGCFAGQDCESGFCAEGRCG